MKDLENPPMIPPRPWSRQELPPILHLSPTLTTVSTADSYSSSQDPRLQLSSQTTTNTLNEDSPRAKKCTMEDLITTLPMTTSGNSKSMDSRVSRRVRVLFGLSKPIFAFVATLALGTTGSFAWLFTEWLSIPGLQEHIQALEEQVHLLAYENDRYARLNAQLNETTMEYKLLNVRLNDSATELSRLNDRLNHSNAVFARLNGELHSQNQVYATLNSELNETQQELAAINGDLMTIAGFLNDTATDLQHNLEALIAHLANQIVVNQVMVLETLRNTFYQRIQSWDCAYGDYFLTEDFQHDGSRPIGNTLPEVLGFVQDRLLIDLCLDQDNLILYLERNVNSLDKLTSIELIQGISRYTTLVMGYYFPETANEEGITIEEWATASYRCTNLERQFVWS